MTSTDKNIKPIPHQYPGKPGRAAAGFLPVLIFMALLNVSTALAHGVSIFAWIQGETVHTQSKFMGGKRPNQALIEVFDETGNLLLKGKTDTQGLFSFKAPKISDMQIVLTAGMGHRAVWTLSKDDFQEAVVEADIHRRSRTKSPGKPVESNMKTHNIDGSTENGLSAAEVVDLVEPILDRKIKPLMDKIIALDENRISLSDILGGVGYIVGLVGLAAYMRYRGKRSDAEK